MDMYGPPSTSPSSSSSSVPTAVSEQPCFRIDDLLDLTNVDIVDVDDSDPHHNYPDPPFNIPTHHHLHYNDFNNVADLCVPSDDAAAELEWLSRFVGGEDDSSSFYAGSILPPSTGSSRPEISADAASLNPGRARSKRSRAPTAKPSRAPAPAARRCAHCLSEKTPQWRAGPAGPKTLCNACGVRFKSGRLVPEYRPAASPSFVLTQHSNSHRKVMELRRQKEHSLLSRHRQHQQGQPPEQDQLYSHHGFRVC